MLGVLLDFVTTYKWAVTPAYSLATCLGEVTPIASKSILTPVRSGG